ncbi:hypothetical protein [Halosegnis longus]|uniref:hypothetical protein n=1 Tax=Halosegnis longus TaxID=2216012 RepID=UPI00129D787E|nr:hypothetical protein [Halosegnis longus]
MTDTGESERDVSASRSLANLQAALRPLFVRSDATVAFEDDCWRCTGDIAALPAPLLDQLATPELPTAVELVWMAADDESTPEPAGEATVVTLTPEGSLTEELLTLAATDCPVGRLEYEEPVLAEPVPEWVAAGELSIAAREFTPYFTRDGAWCLLAVSVETVTEFEHDLLLPVAIDLANGDPLPLLVEAGRQLTEPTSEYEYSVADPETLTEPDTYHSELIAVAETELAPIVDDAKRDATAAAHAEFEEYRETQDARLETLREDVAAQEETIAELRDQLKAVESRDKRMELLAEQDEAKETLDALTEELDSITNSRRDGYPEKQAKIRQRHTINVETTLVGGFEMAYEKGDLTLTVTDGESHVDVQQVYGRDAAFFDAPACAECGATVDEENPGQILAGQLVGAHCCDRDE